MLLTIKHLINRKRKWYIEGILVYGVCIGSALVLKVIDINGGSMTGYVPPSMPAQQMCYPSIYPSQGASFDPNMVTAVVTGLYVCTSVFVRTIFTISSRSFLRLLTQLCVEFPCTAPNGTRIPARVLQQPNGDYKVDYNSPFTGKESFIYLLVNHACLFLLSS